MQDIHSVASVLKLYFRELPNPLLTYQLYDQFIQAVQAADEMRLLRIHHVVNQLPPPHFRLVQPNVTSNFINIFSFDANIGLTN
jgi:Rho GTPase-activating protein 32